MFIDESIYWIQRRKGPIHNRLHPRLPNLLLREFSNSVEDIPIMYAEREYDLGTPSISVGFVFELRTL